MKLSFAIIGPHTSNTQSIVDEIHSRGFIASVYSIKSISFNLENIHSTSFFQNDIYIFRGFNLSYPITQSLAYFLKHNGKVILDEKLSDFCIPSKINESLQFKLHNIPHPHTVYARKTDHWKLLLNTINLPIIVKPEHAQKGQGIQKLNTLESAYDFFKKNPDGFIAQEYLEISYDIRVFIVGDKILGAIKRNIIKGDYRTNASLGSCTEKYTLSTEEKNIALKAHKVMGYDISGVDLIKKNDQTLILEVNIAPQWEAFQKTTLINVASHIITYAIEKYEQN